MNESHLRLPKGSVQVFLWYNMAMERVSILIDGSNFYHLVLKRLGLKEAQFDFEKFAIFLANGRLISDMGKRFYIGTIREKEGDIKTKEAMAKQTSFFAMLKIAIGK